MLRNQILKDLDNKISAQVRTSVRKYRRDHIPIDDDAILVILQCARALFEKERFLIYSKYPGLFMNLHLIFRAIDKKTGNLNLSFIDNDMPELSDEFITKYINDRL
jgi:hypothetical protein